MNFGGHNFVTSVIVVKGLIEEAILGLHFLQQHQCIIDCGQHMLRFSGRNLAVQLDFATLTITRSTRATAVLKETIIVPTNSELETLAVVPNFVNHAGTWLIENQLSHQKMDSSIIVARPLVVHDNHIVVRLIKPTNTPATIYKDTKIASLSLLTDDDQLLVSVFGTAQTPLISKNKRKTL